MANVKKMIPREHGAWMMLYVPLVVGLAEGGTFQKGLLLDWLGLLLLVTGSFAIRVPLTARLSPRTSMHREANRWLLRYAEIALVGAILLARNPNRFLLLGTAVVAGLLFLIHFGLARRREHRGLFGEMLGIAGLTITAPMGYFAALGDDFARAGSLWLLNFLYFASSIFYVRWRVQGLLAEKRRTNAREAHLHLLAYYAVAAVVILVLSRIGPVSTAVLWAFVPLGARYLLPFLTRGAPSLVQVGVSEIVISLAFLFLLVSLM